jgi:hypothetical protein
MDEITKETPLVKAFIGYLYDRDYEAPIEITRPKRAKLYQQLATMALFGQMGGIVTPGINIQNPPS